MSQVDGRSGVPAAIRGQAAELAPTMLRCERCGKPTPKPDAVQLRRGWNARFFCSSRCRNAFVQRGGR